MKATELQRLSRVRNWNKALLKSSMCQVGHMASSGAVTKKEEEQLAKIYSKLTELLTTWDANWKTVRSTIQ